MKGIKNVKLKLIPLDAWNRKPHSKDPEIVSELLVEDNELQRDWGFTIRKDTIRGKQLIQSLGRSFASYSTQAENYFLTQSL